MTTPNVVRDMLQYVEAEATALDRDPSDAKLWYYGISYGTVLGIPLALLLIGGGVWWRRR